MPIPSFSDTLDKTLGPGITIIRAGDFFSNNNEEESGLSVERMNEELAKSESGSDVVFMPSEPPKEDISFMLFLKSLKK